LFPDEDTHNRIFDGIPFSQLAICDIKVSSNNTILSLSDYKGMSFAKISNIPQQSHGLLFAGVPQMLRSCGMEGFKNTRKGTNIAAQATAISLSMV
jgi:small subunit ribosomal protein S11